jgi:hypothetical protein
MSEHVYSWRKSALPFLWWASMSLVLLCQGAWGQCVTPDSTRTPGDWPSAADRWGQLQQEATCWRLAAGVLTSSSIAHLRDSPDAWEQNGWGYGARAASHLGSSVVYLGTEHAVSALLKTRIRRYQPIKDGGFFYRTGHALRAGVTVRARGGGRIPDVPQAGGVLVASLARSQWERGRPRPGQAGIAVAFTLGFEAVRHVLIEFLR